MASVPSGFAWNDTCAWVISMPDAHAQRASVMRQLSAIGVANARVWTGLPLSQHPEQLQPSVDKAAAACLVPPSYVADANASARWHGTVGSSLAHLLLLRHVWRLSTLRDRPHGRHGGEHEDEACSRAKWALVLADDVVMLPGFGAWLTDQMDPIGDRADLVNLAVVRAWGDPEPGVNSIGAHIGAHQGKGSAAHRHPAISKRVSGSVPAWPPWSNGRPGLHNVRNPNLLVSAYLVRVASLPTLLSSFGGTSNWGRRCSIDQVLSRIEFALASARRYTSYNIDADGSLIGHCAVGPEEAALWEHRAAARHAGCREHHASIYGQGSRSHTLRRLERKDKPATDHGGDSDALGCSHDFHVPFDRVVSRGESGGLVTLPAAASHEALDEAAWMACAARGAWR